jgi:hypothetical protein
MSDHRSGQTAAQEFLDQTIGLVRTYAEIGSAFAEIGDDCGATYCIRKMVACVQAASGTLSDRAAEKARKGPL